MRARLGEQYRGLADRVGEQTEHLRSAHGETEIRPSIVEQIKARTQDADQTA